jgi:maleylacetate reductase
MAEADVEQACEIALSHPYWNPRPVERDGLMALLANAWAGNPPRVDARSRDRI